MKAQTITIIGMKRLGVSVALALKAALAKDKITIVGHDSDNRLSQQAKERLGAIDKVEWNLPRAVAQADILVLALPFAELQETLRHISHDIQPHALVLDMASLKGPGLKWAGSYLSQGHYVGVRPILAAAILDDGRSDLESASATFFQNSVFCLMPAANADPKAVETAVNFGLILGATPYFLDAHEYDSLIQGVETVPGLMAAAMFSAVSKTTGWRDMLRFANQPFALTTQPLGNGTDVAQLALHDKSTTLRWLDAFLAELHVMRQWVAEGDSHKLVAILQELSNQRAAWLGERGKNEWAEAKMPTVEQRSFTEQMLGSWASRRVGGKRQDE